MLPKSPVVVITGASSGNGKAIALEFAKQGARLVLAARGILGLSEVQSECNEFGAESVIVTTDVTISEEVAKLAEIAVTRFGRIDVWISNAGIGAVGKFLQTPLDAHEQVVKTNLLGTVYSAYAVMPEFKKQKAGVFIATNSVGAFVPLPIAAGYSASKFGLRGFIEALQGEMSSEPNIHICEIHPAFLNTPGISHVGNYVGRLLKNPPLAGDPLRVAKAVVKLANHPTDRRMVMATTYLMRAAYFAFPKSVRYLSAKFFDTYFQHAAEVPETDGTLFRAKSEHSHIKAKTSESQAMWH